MLITFYAVIAMIVGVVTLVLGFAGVVRGAGQFSAAILLLSLLLFAARAGMGWIRRHHAHA